MIFAECVVASNGLDIDHTMSDFDDGNVEGFSSEVVNRKIARIAIVPTVCPRKRRGGRFIYGQGDFPETGRKGTGF